MGSIGPAPRPKEQLAAEHRRNVRFVVGLLVATLLTFALIVLGNTAGAGAVVLFSFGLLGVALIAILFRFLLSEGPMTAGKIAVGVFVGVLAAAAVIVVGMVALGVLDALW